MKKIESLTEEQKALLPIYRDKWLKIGLSTEPVNRKNAEDALNRAYRIVGLKEPKQIIWATSPLAGSIVISILINDDLMKKIFADFKKFLGAKKLKPRPTKIGASVRASVRDSVWDSVGASVRASVRDSVWDSVWDSVGASVVDSVVDSVWASVRDSVWASVVDSVWDSVRASVVDSVWDSVRASVVDSVGASVRASVRASVVDSVVDSVRASVRDSVRDSVGASVVDSINQAGYGSHHAYWLGFYDYFLEVLKIESCSKLIPLMDLSEHGGWFYPYKNICVITEKPTVIEMKGTRIHCDGGPAIAYKDGFSIWALNGVRLSQELAEAPSKELKVELVLTEKNAQVRAEIVKKIGITRIMKELGVQSIDRENSYELLLLDLRDGRKRPYLKMLNPSTGEIHIEGVHPDCKSVKESLAWRNGINLKNFIQPEVLT